ncbi:NAD(P)/FAD-dependent oxidoreductase [Nostoc sp. CENA67]|uniref:NAD(P)/FAD-dependent oxidoreductase n=1 Tax=Amazonocrinis nigriterrae CENA67 TaxID=2794033 RepID=A0A8J7HP67_9NOST|nr:NAD(P)/FAD-dependent oxidoreductase [Amazonocrinis nigriterrae]MBH8563077.1 NAD(P)/FAD-dependent oxidoreductase [Amazonocrinis nigriterrae CENA67]
MKTDYLIVGSGLSALVFGSLMAKSGKKVQVLESHEHPGGFGHTFTMAKKYKFNAQLHYVWDCGEGQTVNRVLKKLNLDKQVTFERYDPDGFDHMRMPDYSLDIPSEPQELIWRLSHLFPENAKQISKFILEVENVSEGLKILSPPIIPAELFQHFAEVSSALKYLNSTLQDVFNQFKLVKEAQTLLALQWPDFLLPPAQLSFYAWVILFTSYQKGAFYPTQHFEHVINSLVKVIEENRGEVLLNLEVTNFILNNKTITGVKATNRLNHQNYEFTAETIICNIDPQKAAQMIGIENFSNKIRKKLNYEYSPSNYMAYCVVKDIDLRDYGFGKWNTFHTGHQDLNEAFSQMYEKHDFSNPSFAITTPTLITNYERDCPEGCQVIEFLTVANYDYFQKLKQTNRKAYRRKKEEIFNSILNVVEKNYIPDFRKYLIFKITGTPTTNERFCWSPKGNSYGSNLTPKNMGIGRLTYETSLHNFYFCNASSGYPGFAATFWTGANLYQKLSRDVILAK